jgi:hypothetical protein
MKAAQTNTARGARYSKRFNEWLIAHGFTNIDMLKSTRSHSIELVENLSSIEYFRATALTEKERRRLQGPQQNVRRWRRAQQTAEPKRDDIARALAAWRSFKTAMQALSQSQGGEIWAAVAAEAAAHA